MLKKLTTALTVSALAAFSLVSVVSAAGQYADFTIANGDQNEEVEYAVTVGSQPTRLNIGAGDDSDMPTAVFDYTNFTIANGDENEEGDVGQVKVQAAVTVGSEPTMLNVGAGDENDKPTVSGNNVKLNIGASDPAEQS